MSKTSPVSGQPQTQTQTQTQTKQQSVKIKNKPSSNNQNNLNQNLTEEDTQSQNNSNNNNDNLKTEGGNENKFVPISQLTLAQQLQAQYQRKVQSYVWQAQMYQRQQIAKMQQQIQMQRNNLINFNNNHSSIMQHAQSNVNTVTNYHPSNYQSSHIPRQIIQPTKQTHFSQNKVPFGFQNHSIQQQIHPQIQPQMPPNPAFSISSSNFQQNQSQLLIPSQPYMHGGIQSGDSNHRLSPNMQTQIQRPLNTTTVNYGQTKPFPNIHQISQQQQYQRLQNSSNKNHI